MVKINMTKVYCSVLSCKNNERAECQRETLRILDHHIVKTMVFCADMKLKKVSKK